MLKKILPRTPLGITITAAAVLLTVSPEARRFTRRMAVKGIAGMMGMAEGIKGLTSGVAGQISGLISEARSMEEENHEMESRSALIDTDVQPDEFVSSESIPFNVMSDQAIHERVQSTLDQTH